MLEHINSAHSILGDRLDPMRLRPFIHKGESRVIVDNNGRTIKTNAPALLQYEEWLDIDRRVISIATDRLTAIQDLTGRGLVHSLGTIGQTVSLWDRSSDMTPADVNMSGVSQGEEDTPAFETDQVPVPIVHKNFRVNIRRLEASRRMGESIDTTASEIASRVVSEGSEDLLFSGSPIKVEGGQIYGYTNHPNRNTFTISDWSSGSTTGEDIVDDVQSMLAIARADKYHGPFVLYIPGEYETKMDEDYRQGTGTSDTRTIRERILALAAIEDIKVADRLSDGNVTLVQLTRDVVDLAIAQDIATVQWTSQGGMQEHFKVMAVWVPRVKSDYDGQSGIVHGSTE